MKRSFQAVIALGGVGLIITGLTIARPDHGSTKLVTPTAKTEVTDTTATSVPGASASANASVTINNPAPAPFIPGPAQPGEKIAKIPGEKSPKPKSSYPLCPPQGGYLTASLADGCNAQRPNKGGTDWLRGALVTCPGGPAKGLQVVELGPSAPRPLAWGILGTSHVDGPYGFEVDHNRVNWGSGEAGDWLRYWCFGEEYPNLSSSHGVYMY